MIPKFRVWDKEEQKFADWPVYFNLTNSEIVTELWYGYEIQVEEPLQDSNYIVQQSTGLFDKNGTEIYEGDILHHKVQGTGVVFYPYRDTMASFGIRNVNTNFGRNLQDTAKAGYEVIGNKFEHLHLLGEK